MIMLLKEDIDLIHKYLDKIKPKKILEWGPGSSTAIFTKHCKEVYSIEHDSSYYHIAKKHGSKIRCIPITKGTSYATAAYDNAPYDFIFIDGRRRVECAIVALQCLSEGGVIVLHDANRTNYVKPLKKYIQIIDSSPITIVFHESNRNHTI